MAPMDLKSFGVTWRMEECGRQFSTILVQFTIQQPTRVTMRKEQCFGWSLVDLNFGARYAGRAGRGPVDGA